MEDSEPKPTILWKVAKLTVEGLTHQPNHKTLNVQLSHQQRCAGTMEEQSLWERSIIYWSNLRPSFLNEAYAGHCLGLSETEGWIAQRPMREINQ